MVFGGSLGSCVLDISSLAWRYHVVVLRRIQGCYLKGHLQRGYRVIFGYLQWYQVTLMHRLQGCYVKGHPRRGYRVIVGYHQRGVLSKSGVMRDCLVALFSI